MVRAQQIPKKLYRFSRTPQTALIYLLVLYLLIDLSFICLLIYLFKSLKILKKICLSRKLHKARLKRNTRITRNLTFHFLPVHLQNELTHFQTSSFKSSAVFLIENKNKQHLCLKPIHCIQFFIRALMCTYMDVDDPRQRVLRICTTFDCNAKDRFRFADGDAEVSLLIRYYHSSLKSTNMDNQFGIVL